jgi:hypothetical protein
MTLCAVRSDWLRGEQLRAGHLILGAVLHFAPDTSE